MIHNEHQLSPSVDLSTLGVAAVAILLTCGALMLIPAQAPSDALLPGAAVTVPPAAVRPTEPIAETGSAPCRDCADRERGGQQISDQSVRSEAVRMAALTIRIALLAFLVWGAVLSALWLVWEGWWRAPRDAHAR